jgi:serine/threonine protein kinase
VAETPTVIGRYQIRQRLGEGGMGVVYLAHDPAMDSAVAIKLLRDSLGNEDLRRRFAREAQMARRVGVHPNVVTIFDIGEHDGFPFIAMEYVSGETLEKVIRREALPPRLRSLRIVEEVNTGLTHAHKAGLVHRDIKPANIMLTDAGTVKILDFGIARMAESDLTADGIVIGALNYMSPEQMTGMPIDSRSDVFAVGALFYELLSGKRAFPGTIREGLPYRIIHGNPPPLAEMIPDLDPEIDRIVSTALEKDPTKRYQDIATMRHDIARVRRRLETAEIDRAVTQARSALDTGDYDKASLCCEEASLIDPDEPRVIELARRVASARSGEHPAPTVPAAPAGRAGEPSTIRIAIPDSASATTAITPMPGTASITARPITGTTPVPSGSTSVPSMPIPPTPALPAALTPAASVPAATASAAAAPRSRAVVVGLATAALLAAGAIGWFATRSATSTTSQPSASSQPAGASASATTPTQSAPAAPPPSPPTQTPAQAQAASAQSAPTATQPAPSASEPVEAAPTQAKPEPAKSETPTATAAQGAELPPPPVPTAEDRENARLMRNARVLYASGHRDQALEIVDARLEKKDADPEWRTIVRNWHQQAAASVANARVEAEGKQAATKATTQYRQASEAEERSAQLARNGDASGALRRLWEAEELYVRAGQQAEIASQAPPPKVVPPPKATPPAATPAAPASTTAASTAAASTGTASTGAAANPQAAEAEIRRVMREFQMAWNRLDAEGVRRAFPAFSGDNSPRFQNFMLQFEGMRVKINDTHAQVDTVVRHVPRPGPGKMHGGGRTNEALFRFEQRNGRWIMLGNQPVQEPGGKQEPQDR